MSLPKHSTADINERTQHFYTKGICYMRFKMSQESNQLPEWQFFSFFLASALDIQVYSHIMYTNQSFTLCGVASFFVFFNKEKKRTLHKVVGQGVYIIYIYIMNVRFEQS